VIDYHLCIVQQVNSVDIAKEGIRPTHMNNPNTIATATPQATAIGTNIASTPLVNTGTELVLVVGAGVEVVGVGVPVGPTEVVIVVVPFPDGVITVILEVVEVTVRVEVEDPTELPAELLLTGEVMKAG